MRYNTSFMVKAFIAVFSVTLLITAITMNIKYNELSAKKEALASSVEREALDLEEIKAMIDAPIDEDYVKKVAGEEFDYRMSGEIVYFNDLNK